MVFLVLFANIFIYSFKTQVCKADQKWPEKHCRVFVNLQNINNEFIMNIDVVVNFTHCLESGCFCSVQVRYFLSQNLIKK
jgi:hypothetical protein